MNRFSRKLVALTLIGGVLFSALGGCLLPTLAEIVLTQLVRNAKAADNANVNDNAQ